MDELGRPVVWHDGRESLREIDGEKEERRRRVESYLKNSNMSLVCDLQIRLGLNTFSFVFFYFSARLRQRQIKELKTYSSSTNVIYSSG